MSKTDANEFSILSAEDVLKELPDFSFCGYNGGGVALPDVTVRVVVDPVEGDATAFIQAAIDRVSSLELDKDGFRGAVLLRKGTYRIKGQLRIDRSGVVLRGSGDSDDGTLLIATGTSRRTLIAIEGFADCAISTSVRSITDAQVPAGAISLALSDTTGLSAGDDILIERPVTAAWKKRIGVDKIPIPTGAEVSSWDDVSLVWDRMIVAVKDNTITFDAPLTASLEACDGGGTVRSYIFPGKIERVGVENLRCVSEYDTANPLDENHAWDAVTMRHVRDGWVRQVSVSRFAGSAVKVGPDARRITVADCSATNPTGELGTGRRRSFLVLGQQILMLRCQAEGGRAAFAAGRGLNSGRMLPWAAGPNAFVDCLSKSPTGFSGPLQHCASGLLYDNVRIEGGDLQVVNRGSAGGGFGWAGANCVLWNCSADNIFCDAPSGADNWAIGCTGKVQGNGTIQSATAPVQPVSLYRAQLTRRLGQNSLSSLQPYILKPQSVEDVVKIHSESIKTPDAVETGRGLTFNNGWFCHNDRVVWGYGKFSGYWRSWLRRSSLTRDGLDETGQGRTEDIPQLAKAMRTYAYPVWYHSYGLWYDRRRDYHDMGRRKDGNVVPPFFTQPWARSGQGIAWDGLSKYDLTKFDSFYFGQLQKFAEAADREGLILLHNFHLQHCVTGGEPAHYVDFPWRPVNCIQKLDMPDKIPAANAFYDVSDPLKAKLHRLYIRKCLEVLGPYKNVVHLTSAEYSGPASFVKFWMDTIIEWEQETGIDVKIGLGATKDVMDEILADPEYAANIDVLNLTCWGYRTDGTLSSKPGGKQLHLGWAEGTSPEMVYHQVLQVRAKYPDKGIIKLIVPQEANTGYWDGPPETWARYAMACLFGGALPIFHNHVVVQTDRYYGPPLNTPAIQPTYDFINRYLSDHLQRTAPADWVKNDPEKNWCLAKPGRMVLAYASAGGALVLDLVEMKGTLRARWFDPVSGKLEEIGSSMVQGGRQVSFDSPAGDNAWLLWLECVKK